VLVILKIINKTESVTFNGKELEYEPNSGSEDTDDNTERDYKRINPNESHIFHIPIIYVDGNNTLEYKVSDLKKSGEYQVKLNKYVNGYFDNFDSDCKIQLEVIYF
jgi:hypothetical protein